VSASPGTVRAGLATRIDVEAVRQAAVLYGAQLGSSVVGSVFYGLLARSVSRSDFDVVALVAVFILPNLGYVADLGLFAAGARLVAVAESEREERELLGALLALALALSAAFAGAVSAAAPLAGMVYAAGVRDALLAVAPLAAAVPLGLYVEAACQATNRVGLLSAYRFGSSAASLAALGVLGALGPVTVVPALAASLGGTLAAAALACVALGPSFAGVGANARRLVTATREVGLPICAGRAVSLASARLDTVLVPWLAGVANVGLYASAQRFTQPASSFARAVATTRFRAFAAADGPSAGAVRLNAMFLAAATAGLLVAGPTVYTLLYGAEYRDAVPFLLPFTVVALFEGLLQPYNVSLASRGRGRELRRIAVAMGVANLLGLTAAVSAFGLAGAAWWAAASSALHSGLSRYHCRASAHGTGSVSDRVDPERQRRDAAPTCTHSSQPRPVAVAPGRPGR
jgi:O-antigen/teichoic acid export membrane protein